MTTPRRVQFVQGQVAWMVTGLCLLTVLGALSLELFFVVSLVGFLVVVELVGELQLLGSLTVSNSRAEWIDTC